MSTKITTISRRTFLVRSAMTQTLATALFDASAGTFALHEGNPCEGRRRALELPR